MWRRKKKQQDKKNQKSLEIRDIPLNDIRKAIHSFSDDKRNEIPLSILINEDLTLDYELLAPYLHAIPSQTFYMSRETYELFEAKDHELALELDRVQQAVDEYMKQTQELPVIDNDPYKRVNYYKLERLNLLPIRPNRDFYMTNEEFMITYKKPT